MPGPDATIRNLRVLVANERPERLEAVALVVARAGHDVVAESLDVSSAGLLTRSVQPDVAVVAVGRSAEHALDHVEQIAEDASCPVIVLLDESDAEFVAEAARRGVFGYASDRSAEDLQSSIEVALRRFSELRDLEDAFKRRALVERAKGILMERHGLDEQAAFELLRSQARRSQQRLVTVAEAILTSHRLLRPEAVADPAST